MFSNMFSIVYSSCCFFFRVPIPFVYKFSTSGILMGGIIQSLAYLFFYFSLQFFLIEYVAALIALICLSILTGYFHEDGLADTSDSLGIPIFKDMKSKQKCIEALKDSRVGAYGVNSLSIFWIFRCLLLLACNQPGWSGFLSVGLSRLCVLSVGHIFIRKEFLSSINPTSQTHQLANIPLWKNATLCVFQLCFFVAIGAVQMNSINSFALLLFFLSPLIVWMLLTPLSKRTDGINGDYLGATICILEFFHFLVLSFANPSQIFNIWVGK